MSELKASARILVIQLRRIGDVILTTPAVAALKRRYPDARLDFLVEAAGAEALEGNPDIDEILVYDGSSLARTLSWLGRVRRRRYDAVIDFLGNPRSALLTAASGAPLRAGPGHVFHRWAYNLRLTQSPAAVYAGLEKIRLLAPLGVQAEDADARPRLYLAARASFPENLVGLIPASRRATRRWPAASYARLGRLLRERYGCRIVVFWGPGERELAEEVARGVGEGAQPSPHTRSLKELAALMAGCRLVVTNCNGPKHIAVALGIPTVTVHGSSNPAAWNPPHPDHLVVRREELFCIGCAQNLCPYKLECLEGLPPEKVLEAASRLLERKALPA